MILEDYLQPQTFSEKPKINFHKFNFKDIIIFEDEHFIIINKPPHLASLDERNADKKFSVLRLSKEYWHDAQLCHRLDKETSGILAIAKNPEAYRHLSMQFEHRTLTKRYHAMVNGVHDFNGDSVYLPILPLKDGTAVKIDRAKGKIAETIFYTLKAFRFHTLVECQPITGRMHQIRIHLQCLKAPIVCDPTYNGAEVYLSQLKSKKFNLKKDSEELPLIKRVALHAHSLTFKLMNEESITIVAPYPKDFEVLYNKIEQYS